TPIRSDREILGGPGGSELPPGGGAGGAGSKSVASEVQRCSPRTGVLGERWPDRLQLVRLDDVALLEVVEVLEPDAALESLVDLLHVVLETAQGGDAAGEDRLRVAQQAYEGSPGDLAVGDRGAGDGPELGHVEE